MGGLFSKSYYHTDPVTFATQITDTESDDTSNCKEYDYIVVGGGLTGLTVASRLSEDPGVSVLVVEAGTDDRDDPRVWDMYRYGEAFFSELDWSWETGRGMSIRG